MRIGSFEFSLRELAGSIGNFGLNLSSQKCPFDFLNQESWLTLISIA